MSFAVPTSRRVEAERRFTFTIGDVEHSVPFLQYAPAGAVEHFEQGREMSGLMACCDDDDARNAVRSLDSEQLRALFDAWLEASSVTPGESVPSGA